jgi:hypothetical protein
VPRVSLGEHRVQDKASFRFLGVWNTVDKSAVRHHSTNACGHLSQVQDPMPVCPGGLLLPGGVGKASCREWHFSGDRLCVGGGGGGRFV